MTPKRALYNSQKAYKEAKARKIQAMTVMEFVQNKCGEFPDLVDFLGATDLMNEEQQALDKTVSFIVANGAAWEAKIAGSAQAARHSRRRGGRLAGLGCRSVFAEICDAGFQCQCRRVRDACDGEAHHVRGRTQLQRHRCEETRYV